MTRPTRLVRDATHPRCHRRVPVTDTKFLSSKVVSLTGRGAFRHRSACLGTVKSPSVAKALWPDWGLTRRWTGVCSEQLNDPCARA